MKPKIQIRIGLITSAIIFVIQLTVIISAKVIHGSSLSNSLVLLFLISITPLFLFLVTLFKRKLLLSKIFFVTLSLQYLLGMALMMISSEEGYTLFLKALSVPVFFAIILLLWLGLRGLIQLTEAKSKPDVNS